MKCPECGESPTKVLDSRSTFIDTAINRRRICISCRHKFTTYEHNDEERPRTSAFARGAKWAARTMQVTLTKIKAGNA